MYVEWSRPAPPLMTFYGQCLNGWEVPMHFALEGTAGGVVVQRDSVARLGGSASA